MNMADIIICVTTNLFRIYLISRFVHIFAGDAENEICCYWVRRIVYGAFFAINTITYLAFHMMWVNVICNLLGIGLIVLTYTRSLKMILFVTGSIYIVNMACSVAAILPFVDYEDGMGFDQIYEALDMFLVLICELIAEKIVDTRQKTANIQTLSFVFVPLCSIGMLYVITYTRSSVRAGIVIAGIGLVLINFFTFYLYNTQVDALFHKYENEVLRQEVKGYANQLDVMLQGEERVKALRHDMKHHMNELKILAAKGEISAIEEYIDDMREFINNPYEIVSSGNLEIDSVMNYMLYRAEEEGCNVNVKVQLPESVRHSFDINVILGNLLENGIEAAGQAEEKRLDINIEMHQGFLRIQIENSYAGKLEKGHESLLTTKAKKDHHGIGLENVRKIVRKYNGTMEICSEDDLFRVILLLYISEGSD